MSYKHIPHEIMSDIRDQVRQALINVLDNITIQVENPETGKMADIGGPIVTSLMYIETMGLFGYMVDPSKKHNTESVMASIDEALLQSHGALEHHVRHMIESINEDNKEPDESDELEDPIDIVADFIKKAQANAHT